MLFIALASAVCMTSAAMLVVGSPQCVSPYGDAQGNIILLIADGLCSMANSTPTNAMLAVIMIVSVLMIVAFGMIAGNTRA